MAPYVPRPVIITGSPDVVVREPLRRIDTQLFEFPDQDLANLPLELIGALILRRYARKEPLFDPVEFRPPAAGRKES